MKRIIDGMTYNTETGWRGASIVDTEENRARFPSRVKRRVIDLGASDETAVAPSVAAEETLGSSDLYQAAHGVFFVATDEDIYPIAAYQARELLIEAGWADLVRGVFGDGPMILDGPDAGTMPIGYGKITGESATAKTLRLPPALKRRLHQRAEAEGLSANAAIIRAVEAWLGTDAQEPTAPTGSGSPVIASSRG